MDYRNPVIPGFHPDPSICRVGDDYYQVIVRARSAPFDQMMATARRPDGPVVLQVETAPGSFGSGVVRLGLEGNVLSELDGRYLSTEMRTGFTGRLIGMYAVGGDASFDWSDYHEVGE